MGDVGLPAGTRRAPEQGFVRCVWLQWPEPDLGGCGVRAVLSLRHPGALLSPSLASCSSGLAGSPQVQCSCRGATGHSGHCLCPHQESSVRPHAPWGPHFHDRAPFRELTHPPPVHFGGQSGKTGTAPNLYLSGKALAARLAQDIGCGLPSLPYSATLRDRGPVRLPPPPAPPPPPAVWAEQQGRAFARATETRWGSLEARSDTGLRPAPYPGLRAFWP